MIIEKEVEDEWTCRTNLSDHDLPSVVGISDYRFKVIILTGKWDNGPGLTMLTTGHPYICWSSHLSTDRRTWS